MDLDIERFSFALSLTSIPFYIIGFIGNVLVIRIVHKTRAMHTTTNYLLANLAVSDCVTIFLAPLYFYSHLLSHQSNGFGNFTCKFLVLTYISVAATSFTLTLLAIERYHALLKPFRTGLRLKKDNVKKAIIIIWVASILLCSPEFFIQEWSETFSTCVGVWSFHINQTSRVLMIRFCIFTSYIPLAIFLYCYGSLVKGLYFTNTICSANSTEEDRSNKKKLVVTFMIATAGFVICYLPIQLFYTFVALGGDKHISFKLHSTLSALVTFIFDCSLCFNPILYAFRSTSFRDGFKRIMLCRRTTSE